MKNIVFIIGALAVIAGTIYYIANLNTTASYSKAISSSPQTKLSPPTVQQPATSTNYYYPLRDYASRILERRHGQYFKASDQPNAACGKPFQGFHAGDDLETTALEKNEEVPVVAITAGKILSVGFVGGYGGLVVQSANINSAPVTIYYGHMDLKSVKLKPKDQVSAGEPIGNLGDDCSPETDDARKHLHFAIRQGTGTDVRGYVPTKDVLATWLNPNETLEKLNATSPE